MKKRGGEKNYIIVAGGLLVVLGVLHLARIIMDWQVMIENQVFPMWFSALAVVVAWTLGGKLLKIGCS
ncbi:MAG TPA: hypothetical protein VJZ93_02535 [Candidatus Nanoarchaeia archaeon]|nr:hypothetical protein [Candidatus Nanoarchaeia archaeon]